MAARGLPWGPKTHRNQSQAQLQLSEPENPPGEKQKKTTGPRLSSEPKFNPIKNGKKPPPVGCRGGQKCIGIKANNNCSSWSQKVHLVKNRKKRQDRGCRRSQNSTRSKRGKKHRPR